MAFQIQDDILDIVGDASTVGKTLGIDIEKGKLTLPMIHFMQTAPRGHRQFLRTLLQSPSRTRGRRSGQLVLPSESIDYATGGGRGSRWSGRRARSRGCRIREARRVLDVMAEFVVARSMCDGEGRTSNVQRPTFNFQ